MNPNQQWNNWPPPPQGGFPPPMPNGMNPFGMPFGQPFNPNPSWSQQAPQAPAPSPFHSAAQENDRGREQGEYQIPSQKRRRQRRRASPAKDGEEPRERERRPPRRAAAPTWNFGPSDQGQGQEQFCPAPMGNAAPGPFASTRPAFRNGADFYKSNRDNKVARPSRDRNTNRGDHYTPRDHFRTTRETNNQNGFTHSRWPPTDGSNPRRTLEPGSPLFNNNKNDNNHRPSPRPAPRERDAITPPSPASGGVPEPTTAYLMRASFLPLPAPAPRPLLVVIDLNGTLLHRPNKRAATKFVERPGARAFLKSCLDKHHVVLWSSARPENVQLMCASLLPRASLDRVVAIWGRERFGLTAEDYMKRTQCYKRLTRLWSDPTVAASHPHQAQDAGASWNQGNTVLIDDSAEKARSEPHNAVTLPEFLGDPKGEPKVLAQVTEYLDTLSRQVDVSTYIRAHPFQLVKKDKT